jgi:hypothetical protein
VEGAGDRAVGAAGADEGDALEAAGFPCHFFVPLCRSRSFASSFWPAQAWLTSKRQVTATGLLT